MVCSLVVLDEDDEEEDEGERSVMVVGWRGMAMYSGGGFRDGSGEVERCCCMPDEERPVEMLIMVGIVSSYIGGFEGG